MLYRKGHTPWNKNKTDVYSEKTLKQRSKSLKGRHWKVKDISKYSERNSGKNNPMFGKRHTDKAKLKKQ